jgi:hypothetical protein
MKMVYIIWEFYWGPDGMVKDIYEVYLDEKKAQSFVDETSKSKERSFLATWYEMTTHTVKE